MVLVSPNTDAFKTFMQFLTRDESYGNPNCISGFDEQIIAETLIAMQYEIHHIHQSYNWIAGKDKWLLNGETPRTRQFYNSKPWLEDKEVSEWNDVREWYEIADDIIERYPEYRKWFYSYSS
jgi:hypothetical protein